MWILGLLFMGLAASSFSGGGEDTDDENTAPGYANDTETENEEAQSSEPVVRDGLEGILIEGGSNTENLMGTGGPDLMDGGAGDDTIQTFDGDDALLGGLGDDVLRAGGGEDFLTGGRGDDLLLGGNDSDTLLGDAGQDTLNGGSGDDWLYGADITSRDMEVADFHEDREAETELEYNDPTSREEADELFGGAGNDQLILGEHDTATGGEGLDTFNVGHWTESNAPFLTDFDPDEDVVSIIVPEDEPLPTITVERVGDETHVLADDVIMARIAGAAEDFDASDVTFVTL